MKCSCGFQSKNEFAFCPDCGSRYISKDISLSTSEFDSSSESAPNRKLKVPVAILLIIVSAMTWQMTVGSTTTVPNVLGSYSETARTQLEEAHLSVIETSASSNTMSKGYVMSVDPPAGEKLKKNESVRITISTGSDTVKVPDLMDLSLESAIDILSGLELLLVVDSEVYSSKPQGVVTKSLVKSGTVIKKGSEVHVLISKGPKPVEPTPTPAPGLGTKYKDPEPYSYPCGSYFC